MHAVLQCVECTQKIMHNDKEEQHKSAKKKYTVKRNMEKDEEQQSVLRGNIFCVLQNDAHCLVVFFLLS
jgi:hypothetical protein